MSGTTHPLVGLKDGTVRGTARSGASAFLGIPYAAPPFGANRLHHAADSEPGPGLELVR
jgi:para-nitrobenzyl esterase